MRRHKQREKQAQAPKTQFTKEPVTPGIPNTPELSKEFFALQAKKIQLSKDLRARTKSAIIVTIELDDQGWYFLVRGADPRISNYYGTKVKYVPGVLEFGQPDHQRQV